MNVLPDGWAIGQHGNAWGPHGVRVWIDANGLNVKHAPHCGNPVPIEVITLLCFLEWLRSTFYVKYETQGDGDRTDT